MRYLSKLFILLFSIILFSCGSSVEQEQGSWNSNKKTVSEYKSKYPYMSSEIDAQFQEAETAMETAKAISDEDKKIDAMVIANYLTTEGPIEKTQRFENSIENLQRTINEVKNEVKSEEFTSKTSFLLEDASEALKTAKKLLATDYTSAKDALPIFVSNSNILEDMERSLSDHLDEIESNRVEEENVVEESSVSSENNSNSNEKASLSCNKCGGKVSDKDVNCPNCGAPVKN